VFVQDTLSIQLSIEYDIIRDPEGPTTAERAVRQRFTDFLPDFLFPLRSPDKREVGSSTQPRQPKHHFIPHVRHACDFRGVTHFLLWGACAEDMVSIHGVHSRLFTDDIDKTENERIAQTVYEMPMLRCDCYRYL
jgi:hypothetical protein